MDLKSMSSEELTQIRDDIIQELRIRSRQTPALEELLANCEVKDSRKDRLVKAIELGATREVLERIRDAVRTRDTDTIRLPQNRLEGKSRGRGWARKGKGDSAEWGERDGGYYLVGPGTWTVGGSDGFRRKDSDTWVVEHVQVGDKVWTIAN